MYQRLQLKHRGCLRQARDIAKDVMAKNDHRPIYSDGDTVEWTGLKKGTYEFHCIKFRTYVGVEEGGYGYVVLSTCKCPEKQASFGAIAEQFVERLIGEKLLSATPQRLTVS